MATGIDIARIIEEEAPAIGVNPDFFKRIVFKGERSGVDATSPKGAYGVAQVMPATFEALKRQGRLPDDADIKDVRTNIKAGLMVAKEGLDLHGGSESAAAAHYNGGNAAGKAVAAGKQPPAQETRDYLTRVAPMDTTATTGATAGSNQAGSKSNQVREGIRITTKQPGIPIAELQGDLSNFLDTQQKNIAELNAAMLGASNYGVAASEAILQAGAAKAGSIQAQGEIDTAQQLQKVAIRDTFNSSISSPDSQIVDAQRAREEAQRVKDQLRTQIDAEDQVQPWTDPLRWVVNQFTLPNLKRAYNAANAVDRDMTQRITTLQAQTAAQMQIDTAPVVDQLRQKAALDAQAATFESLIASNKAMQESKTILAQGVMQKMRTAGDEFQGNVELARLFAQSTSLSAQEAAISRENAALKPTVDAINLKRATVGLAPYTIEEVKMLDTKTRSELTANAKILGSYGQNPGESYAWLNEQGALNNIAQTNPTVFNFLRAQIGSSDFQTTLQEVGMNPKFANLSPDEKRAEAFRALALKQQEAIGKGNNSNNQLADSNPYKLKLLNTTMYPELKDNVFVSVAADAAALSPTKQVTDKDMMLSLLAKAEADPTKVPALAKQFSEFYRVGSQQQWEKSGAKVMGYPAPLGYGISGVMTNVTGKAVQTWTPAEVEHWIVTNMAARKQAAIGSTLFPPDVADPFLEVGKRNVVTQTPGEMLGGATQ